MKHFFNSVHFFLMIFFLAMLPFVTACGSGFEDDGTGTAPWQGTLQFGTTAEDKAISSALDNSGNIYIAGNTLGAFEGYTSQGNIDTFLAKFDSSGKKLWIKQFGSSGNDYTQKLLLDASGNIYVVVFSDGDFNGYSNLGDFDSFLVKYNSSGEEIWTSHIGTDAFDRPNDAAIDSKENIYVTGHTQGDLDGTGSGTYLGDNDTFLVKYNPSGSIEWIRQKGTTGSDEAYGIAIDKTDSIYIAGCTNGDLAGAGSHQGSWDMFYIKYNELGSAGTPVQYGTTASEEVYRIAVDSSGNIYLSGDTKGALPGNTHYGSRDIFLIKFDSGDSFCWVKQTGSDDDDRVWDIDIDSSGNLYLTGFMHSNTTDTPNIPGNFYIVSYNSSGDIRWNWEQGTAYSDVGIDVMVDSNDNVYLTGYTCGGIDGNSNADTGNSTYDAFMMKFDSSGELL
ncbi:MAG: hypothetical protein GY754_23175 [bacterium]|nr:hypothetical protein [bacterium]